MTRSTSAAALIVASLGLAGCARLGFTDRVLHEVPSPDGRFVAVCQEVPAFDGPEFEVRLHRPDGALVRPLGYFGDAYRCNEVVWSPEASHLAVLNHGNAQVRLIDIGDALARPPAQTLWSRTVTLADRGDTATSLRFVSARRVAYLSCSLAQYAASTTPGVCTVGAKDRRLDVIGER
jgi:hypothetical protein